ncbi:MAG: hypothetical protein Q8R53_03840 [Nanoarchaeota archaeon]|nr:hypothetical protein [Nanoarchaeota archaeon]
MNLKTGLMGAGLVALLGVGCEKHDVSVTESHVLLTRPSECAEVRDIRYVRARGIEYQLLCTDSAGNMALYRRNREVDSWEKIEVR